MNQSCHHIQEAMLRCDTEATLPQAHRDHMASCSECQSLWSAHTNALHLGEALQQRRGAPPRNAAWAAQRVLNASASGPREQPPERPSLRSWSWIAAAAVAAFALVVGLGPAPSGTPPSQQTMAQRSPNATKQPPVAPLKRHQIASAKARKQRARDLQRLMAQAFHAIDDATSATEPWTSEEEIAAELGRALEEDAAYHMRFLASIRYDDGQPLNEMLKMYEFVEVDPSPISQRLPAPLRSLGGLLGRSNTREL